MKEKKKVDILLVMAIIVLSAGALYIAFCWAAKIIWGIDPPEGTSLTAVAVVVPQILTGGGIQVFKKMGKTAKVKELEAENAALKRQAKEAIKETNKFRKAAGLDQVRLENI